MRRILAVSAVLFLAAAPLRGVRAEEIGSPLNKSEPKAIWQERIPLTLGTSFSENRWRPDDDKGGRFAESTAEQNQIYLETSFSGCRYLEPYFRLGVSNFTLRRGFQSTTDDEEDLNDSTWKGFGTVGLRATLFDSNGLFGGTFFQATWYGNYDDRRESSAGGFDRLEFRNRQDLVGGFAFGVHHGGASLYAGPIFYRDTAELRLLQSRPAGDTLTTTDVRETGEVGAFVGLTFPLCKRTTLNLEGQFRSEASYSASLTYAF